MQGVFDSSGAGSAALTATGTSGAEGIRASSDGIVTLAARNDARTAVNGGTLDGIGVIGRSLGSGIGVLADSVSGSAINASSKSGKGIIASSHLDIGIVGESFGDSIGVVGIAPNCGIAAFNPNNENAAYLAGDGNAAWFTGNVICTGAVFKGGGGFRIDHPLHPETKYLAHSFVESPEMKNIYDGEILADVNGEAIVRLPDWFGALNREYRYQLTAIGGASPDLHVRDEIRDNQFKIAGARPGSKVCWQVTGIRYDPWAEHNRVRVEVDKAEKERGHLLHPELHGKATESSLGRLHYPTRRSSLAEVRDQRWGPAGSSV